MVLIRAAGIKVNDTAAAQMMLQALETYLEVPPQLDGSGVATCKDSTVLLKKVPSALQNSRLSHLLGDVKGHVGLMQVRTAQELRPIRGSLEPKHLGPFRWHAFAAAVVGGYEQADSAHANREELYAQLPDFLRRGVVGYNENEAFFFHLLSCGLKDGTFNAPLVNIQQVGRLIRQVLEQDLATNRSVIFSTGVELAIACKGNSGYMVSLVGQDIAELSLACDDPVMRARMNDFKGTFLGVGSGETTHERMQTLQEGQVGIVARDLRAVVMS